MRIKRIVFDNATILCNEDFEVVNGYLVVKDGIIKEIGEGKSPYRDVVNVKRGVVFPAFTNAHVHLGDSIAKDAGAYKSIEERVGKNGIKFSVLKEYEKEVQIGIKGSAEEMFYSGTTAFCDFREGGLKGIMRVKSLLGAFDTRILGRPDGNNMRSVLRECDGIGISSLDDYPYEELEEISRIVREEKKILAMHVAEVRDDCREALKLKPDFVVHLTNASEESLERVFETNTPVVLCARANAMLGAGVPDLKKIFENTLVALGTDNVMVNSTDMFREMEFVFKLVRGLNKDYTFDARRVLKAATMNGRLLLGMEKGVIVEGEKANFNIAKRIRYIYDPVIALVHRAESKDIKYIVKGEKLYKSNG